MASPRSARGNGTPLYGHWSALLLLMILLSACDPTDVPNEAEEAWLDVSVTPQGRAKATVRIAGDAAAELIPTASAVSKHLDATEPPDVRVDRNDPAGVPIASLASFGVFAPGPQPTMELTWDGLVGSMTRLGYSRVLVSVCTPSVPTSVTGRPSPSLDGPCVTWALGRSGPDISVAVAMRSDPARFWRVAPFLAVVILGTAACATLYRRSPEGGFNAAAGVALIAIASSVAAFMAGATDLGDHLGVAGVQGFRTWVAGLGPAAAIVAGVVSMGVFGRSMWGPRPRN